MTTGCKEPADVIFALDSSGSVGEQNFEQLKQFAKDVVSNIDVTACNYRFGLLKVRDL